MSFVLGIDTSNYTTSVALYDTSTDEVIQRKKLLPVKEGQLGLRQSDAVFHHVRQLPEVMAELFADTRALPDAVGVSVSPRPIEGSYMPCFEVGRSSAEQIGSLLGVPVHRFSHQEGHIMAALYSAGCIDTIGDRFVAYHLSGGTTEAVLVAREGDRFAIEYLCGSLDLKAGQAIDRVAGMLGLPFPGGVHLDKLASRCEEKIKCKPTLKGLDCCLSGIENKCKAMLEDGQAHEYIAKMCLEYICASVAEMTRRIIAKYGDLPIIFAGGVSSNSLLRERICSEFDAYFAEPQYSCDNAAGIAILAARKGN
ncbi:MAG: peptidase M22 [Clostridia bacterium]|nr:peptidase M22 [Clostridia bacterium]